MINIIIIIITIITIIIVYFSFFCCLNAYVQGILLNKISLNLKIIIIK